MKTMYLAVEYLGMRARNLGRTIFHSDAGALTLEWIVIAAGLVIAAGFAVKFITGRVHADVHKIK